MTGKKSTGRRGASGRALIPGVGSKIAGIGLLVAGCAFREATGDDGREPPQLYGSNQVELA